MELVNERNALTGMVEETGYSYQLKTRIIQFTYQCYDLCELIPDTYAGKNVKSQMVRSSSSIGANYIAVCCAQSKRMFVSKLSIVIEETDETIYWMEYLKNTSILEHKLRDVLYREAKELAAIFNKSRKTAVENLKREKFIKLV